MRLTSSRVYLRRTLTLVSARWCSLYTVHGESSSGHLPQSVLVPPGLILVSLSFQSPNLVLVRQTRPPGFDPSLHTGPSLSSPLQHLVSDQSTWPSTSACPPDISLPIGLLLLHAHTHTREHLIYTHQHIASHTSCTLDFERTTHVPHIPLPVLWKNKLPTGILFNALSLLLGPTCLA